MMQNDVVDGGKRGKLKKTASGLEFPTLEPPDTQQHYTQHPRTTMQYYAKFGSIFPV